MSLLLLFIFFQQVQSYNLSIMSILFSKNCKHQRLHPLLPFIMQQEEKKASHEIVT